MPRHKEDCTALHKPRSLKTGNGLKFCWSGHWPLGPARGWGLGHVAGAGLGGGVGKRFLFSGAISIHGPRHKGGSAPTLGAGVFVPFWGKGSGGSGGGRHISVRAPALARILKLADCGARWCGPVHGQDKGRWQTTEEMNHCFATTRAILSWGGDNLYFRNILLMPCTSSTTNAQRCAGFAHSTTATADVKSPLTAWWRDVRGCGVKNCEMSEGAVSGCKKAN